MGRSLPQLCSDQPHATFTLRQTESALHFHALALSPIVLSLVSGFTLLGPPQSRAGKTDPMRLAIADILPVSIDFVRQDPAGVMPLSRSESLCHFPQISRLIVGVNRKGADGEPEIVPSEAAIVERIFNLYLAGETVDKISKMMQAENYDIPDKTISFSKGMIMNMLSNERYCGDVILQKSVTIDCIEKKRKKNTGEAPMYYVQNNHPAIIDRVTFNKVQEELARRKTKTPGSAKSSITSTGKYSRYALTDVLICGNCGTRYRRVTWSRNGVKRIVWRCISRLDYGKKYCSDSPTIMEDKLQEAIVRAVNKFNEQDNATYKALMRATISEALGLNGDPEEVDMLERKVEALNNKMLALVNESVSSGDGIEAHESEFMTLSQETELLKQRIAAIQESTAKDNGEQSRLEQIQAIISERESKCMEYDDSIVRQMVECIKVYPGGKLEIIFGGGYLVEESV